MNSPIRNMLAAGHVLACRMSRASGVGCGQLPFTHLPGNAAATTVNLWMVQLSRSQTMGGYSIGVNASNLAEAFEFAKQTGFTCNAGSVMEGDAIVFDGVTYRVTSVAFDPLGATVLVECSCKIARTL